MDYSDINQKMKELLQANEDVLKPEDVPRCIGNQVNDIDIQLFLRVNPFQTEYIAFYPEFEKVMDNKHVLRVTITVRNSSYIKHLHTDEEIKDMLLYEIMTMINQSTNHNHEVMKKIDQNQIEKDLINLIKYTIKRI